MISAIPIKSYCKYLQGLGRLPTQPIESCLALFGRSQLELKSYEREKFLALNLYRSGATCILEFLPQGAPAALIYFELLKSLGLKKWITVGFAGAASDTCHMGEVVCVERSYSFAALGAEFSTEACQILPGIKPVRNFTTDHPFDSAGKAQFFKENAIQTVDMEATALAAASARAHIEYSAVFVLSDFMGESWVPGFKEAQASLKAAQELAISHL